MGFRRGFRRDFGSMERRARADPRARRNAAMAHRGNQSHQTAPKVMAIPRILIVDGDPAVHEEFRRILGRTSTAPGKATEAAPDSLLFEALRQEMPTEDLELVSAFHTGDAVELVGGALAEDRPFAVTFFLSSRGEEVETIDKLWRRDPAVEVVVCIADDEEIWEKTGAGDGLKDHLVILKKPVATLEIRQLAHVLIQKWAMAQEARVQMERVELMVAQRTGAMEKANAELRRSDERFGTAFRASPIALAIHTSDESRFVDVNPAFLAMSGFSPDELIGHTPLELAWLIDYKDPLAGIGSIRNAEAQISTRGGELRDVLISTEQIILAGKAHVLLMLQDVSERLQLEAQLRQSQKMEAVGQLAAGVAHDFNNLLTVIEGHASLQLGSPDLSADVAESFQQIEHAAQRAADLTRQLLVFSRRQIIRPRVLSLNSLIGDLSAMLQRVLGEKVQLECRCEEGLPLIFADQTNIEQIVMNLTLNARDAMPKGGVITLFTEMVEITARQRKLPPEARRGRYAVLGVRDTGIGMDASTRARMYEPFFTTKDVNKGTGMGLATVYGIARQHDGWIDVNTSPGNGTTFRVHLPATEKVAQPELPREVPKPLFGLQPTVFIVEDDASVRGLVKEVLQHHDFQVIEAASGDAALAMWPEVRDRVELLLTDMVMPGNHNGLELAEKLRADRAGLKVIYTSGYSADLFASNVQLQEGRNYLPKPYLSSKLISILRQALGPEHSDAR